MPDSEPIPGLFVSFGEEADTELFARSANGELVTHLTVYDEQNSRQAFVFLDRSLAPEALLRQRAERTFRFRKLIRMAVSAALSERQHDSHELDEVSYIRILAQSEVRDFGINLGLLREHD